MIAPQHNINARSGRSHKVRNREANPILTSFSPDASSDDLTSPDD